MGKENKMKNVKYILILLFSVLSFEIIYSNPIMEFFLNELLLKDNNKTNWTLEIRNQSGMDFEGGYLTTLNDTAYFKPEISWYKNFILITNDSLLSPLPIDPYGDVLTIYDINDNWYDEIRFGDMEEPEISAPKSGQSICIREYFDDWQRYYYYLDQSPTLGNENDSINARGNIEGYVTDRFDNPLEGVKIIYDYGELLEVYYDIYVLTDSSGYFIFRDYSRLTDLIFEKDSYQTEKLSQQIWPDSTITIFMTMEDTLELIVDENPVFIRNDFKLSQNYPNPFNSQTTITYAIPLSDFVEITIFDMAGKQIDKLFNGYQNAGQQRLIWNAEAFASGVYIYQIRTSQTVINKKCLLVR